MNWAVLPTTGLLPLVLGGSYVGALAWKILAPVASQEELLQKWRSSTAQRLEAAFPP